ncbi:hypothetical protein [Polaribacter sp. HL-MS24]|nr:hypothetical protein [Polaribacter sp. HL-MS24]WOC40024.1 hypothetical protein RRF69_10445 [Polaribacter sp. HL-MS24]
MQKSVAGPQYWKAVNKNRSGGAVQYEVLDWDEQKMVKWYKEIGKITH